MNLIVIHEKDYEDGERSVIGVADSVSNAEKIIDEYYGKDSYKEVSFNDIRDYNLEYSKVIDVTHSGNYGTCRFTLTLEWFKLNNS